MNKRRGGFYWQEGKPYVSVTEVLKVIAKPALSFWFGKCVYLAMAKDPSLSQREALAAPYKESKKAMRRGTLVHKIIELWKEKKMQIPEELQGYVTAFEKWNEDNEVELVEHEKTIISEKHNFAGTLDLIAKVNGKLKILDIKTGKDIYPESYLN